MQETPLTDKAIGGSASREPSYERLRLRTDLFAVTSATCNTEAPNRPSAACLQRSITARTLCTGLDRQLFLFPSRNASFLSTGTTEHPSEEGEEGSSDCRRNNWARRK